MAFQPNVVQQAAFQLVVPLTRLVHRGTLSLSGGASTSTLGAGVSTLEIEKELVMNEGG